MKTQSRRALAPVLATVVIIASTIVITVATGGFIYGTLGSSANAALVGVQTVKMPSDINTGFTFIFCYPNAGNFAGGYVELFNSGTAPTRLISLTFNYAGSSQTIVPQGSCEFAPDTILYVIVVAMPLVFPPFPGSPYSGYVSAANGAEIMFDGTFV